MLLHKPGICSYTKGPSRRHFCDLDGWVRAGMRRVLQQYASHLSSGGDSGSSGGAEVGEGESGRGYNEDGGGTSNATVGIDGASAGTEQGGVSERSGVVTVEALPRMRFMCYDTAGGIMAPHVDLSKIADRVRAYALSNQAPPPQKQPTCNSYIFVQGQEPLSLSDQLFLLHLSMPALCCRNERVGRILR
jgi:hypothetical protein